MVGISTERNECTVGHATQVKNEEKARKLLLEAFRLAKIKVADDIFETTSSLGCLCGYLSPEIMLKTAGELSKAAKKLRINPANLVTLERLSRSDYPRMASWKIMGRLPPEKPASAPTPKAKWVVRGGLRIKTL